LLLLESPSCWVCQCCRFEAAFSSPKDQIVPLMQRAEAIPMSLDPGCSGTVIYTFLVHNQTVVTYPRPHSSLVFQPRNVFVVKGHQDSVNTRLTESPLCQDNLCPEWLCWKSRMARHLVQFKIWQPVSLELARQVEPPQAAPKLQGEGQGREVREAGALVLTLPRTPQAPLTFPLTVPANPVAPGSRPARGRPALRGQSGRIWPGRDARGRFSWGPPVERAIGSWH
jgi:hypothetical protein